MQTITFTGPQSIADREGQIAQMQCGNELYEGIVRIDAIQGDQVRGHLENPRCLSGIANA